MGCRFATRPHDDTVNRTRLGLAMLILLICVCVFMQVLGTPVGLVDLLDSQTTVESSLSEGFAIPPTQFEVRSVGAAPFFTVPDSPQYQLSLASLWFHPPQS